jgi:hypothetical protein
VLGAVVVYKEDTLHLAVNSPTVLVDDVLSGLNSRLDQVAAQLLDGRLKSPPQSV